MGKEAGDKRSRNGRSKLLCKTTEEGQEEEATINNKTIAPAK